MNKFLQYIEFFFFDCRVLAGSDDFHRDFVHGAPNVFFIHLQFNRASEFSQIRMNE